MIIESLVIGGLFGGVIGNRADHFLVEGVNTIYRKLRESSGEPENHDLRKAIWISCLNASLISIDHHKSKSSYLKRNFTGVNAELLEAESFIKKEIRKTAKSVDNIPILTKDNEHEYLLNNSPKGPGSHMLQLVSRLKQYMIGLLESNDLLEGTGLEESIVNGWEDEGRRIDWYELVCAFFKEQIKDDTRLTNYLEARYLNEIVALSRDTQIKVGQVSKHLEQIRKEHQEHIKQLALILTYLDRIEQRLDELQKLLEQKLDRAPRLPLGGRHRELLDRIVRLEDDFKEAQEEVRDARAELEEADESRKARKQRLYEKAQKRMLEISREKETAESELESFTSEVMELADKLGQPSTDRLTKARELYMDGKFEEVYELLKGQEIDREIGNLASELMIRAQSILVVKPEGWFERAKKDLEKAAAIHEKYESCFTLAHFLARHNQTDAAVEWYWKSLDHAKGKYQLAITLNELGVSYQKQNHFAKARVCFQESISLLDQLNEQFEGGYEPNLAISLNNLGLLLLDTQLFDESEAKFKKALALERELEVESGERVEPYIAAILNNLGNLYRMKCEFEKAEKNSIAALEIRRKLANEDARHRIDLAKALNTLGFLYRVRDESGKALISYREALELMRKLAGENPYSHLPGLANVLNNLGILELDQQKPAAAGHHLEEALQIRRDLSEVNPDQYRPAVAISLNNLGILKWKLREYRQSAACFDEALVIYHSSANTASGSYINIDIALTLNNQGVLQFSSGDYKGAILTHNKALAMREKLAREKPETFNWDVAMSLHNLGNAQRMDGEYEGAKTNLQRALVIRNELAGIYKEGFESELASTSNSLGCVCLSRELYDQALDHFEAALEIRRSLADNNRMRHLPQLAASLHNLGLCYELAGDPDRAERSYTEALEARKELYEVDPELFHIDYARTSLCLALFYLHSQFDRESSISFAKKVIRLLQGEQSFPALRWSLLAQEVIKDWAGYAH